MPILQTKTPLGHYVVQCSNVEPTVQQVRTLTGWQAPVVSADTLTVRWGAFASSVADSTVTELEKIAGVTVYAESEPKLSEEKSRLVGGFKVTTAVDDGTVTVKGGR